MARPGRLEEIDRELAGAIVQEILELGCFFGPKCSRPAAGGLHLAYADGTNTTYYGCKEHLKEFAQRHPRLAPALKQSFFVG